MTSGPFDNREITRTPGTETAVLAGGCFWGVQDLIRRQPGVISTRASATPGGRNERDYRNHALTPKRSRSSSTRRKLVPDILEFFFQIHDPSTLTAKATTSGRATVRRSSR